MSAGPSFEIRAACVGDEADLLALAEHLNSVNLPHDPEVIGDLLARSEASFTGEIEDPRRRTYLFTVRDLRRDRAAGTSMILAQLGTPESPYVFFDVRDEERYSETLGMHFVHQVLTVGYSYRGPTEIGGLVVHPEYRLFPERLGKLISYVRFLYIAAHRERFQSQVLAELLPPLEEDGRSHLWEAVGRRFTNLTYRDADRLSKTNKEFIRGLFPAGEIYVSLLSPEAQAVVGKVGKKTRGVQKMLQRIGFRYIDRVDPFDGGPHFMAPTDEVTLVKDTRRMFVRRGSVDRGQAPQALIAVESHERPYFRALAVPYRRDPKDQRLAWIEAPFLDHLEVPDGGKVQFLPFPSSASQPQR